jgi:hypothetical protein
MTGDTRIQPISAELLPCPFCGGSNIEALDNFDWVCCQDCGASLEDVEPSARELWNTRPSSVAYATVWQPIETAPRGPMISVARKGGQRHDGSTYWYQAVGHYDPNLGHFHKQHGELYGDPELWAAYPENPEHCSLPSTDRGGK